MLSRLQQFVSVGLLLATLAWATGWWLQGQPWVAVIGAIVIAMAHAFFLGAEFLLMARLQTDDVAPRPDARQLCRAWFDEVLTASQVFLWRQPFRAHAEADNLPATPGGRRGVVLVHGFFCNRGLWNPWMRTLRADGRPFIAINLEPLFGSIDRYPLLIDAAVARVEGATGQTVVVVGHSMGGVAIRAWLDRSSADARVHRVITIGSPHRGTWLARFGHTLNGRQMRPRSPWLRQLASREPAKRYARFTCFFSHCDNIVFPAGNATLPGAENVHLPGTAHVDMAFHPQVLETVRAWLR